MGSQPAYNVPLALLGVFVPHFPRPVLATLLFVLLPTTIILDITWCSLYGPYLGSGAPLFSLVMSVFNLFAKLPLGYCAFGLMESHGGQPMLLLQPEMAMGGSAGAAGGGGTGSEHERIADI